jgi:hypothetical protein
MSNVSFGSNRRKKTPPPTGAWQDGQTYGAWKQQWGMSGLTQVVGSDLQMQPGSAYVNTEAGSCLATSTASFGDIAASTMLTTLAQLRTARTPDPWEVAWFLWRYTDNNHFYAITLEPGGWSLSKQDPTYPGAQRFLSDGSSPGFPIGTPISVQVKQIGPTMTVTANGKQLVTFTDTQAPYLTGGVGLYCETAHAQFSPVVLNGTTLPW